MSAASRQRVDVWLWYARFTKTRAAATRLVSEGGVRLSREATSRQLEKPSVEVQPGDTLLFRLDDKLRAVRIDAIGQRRGPSREAHGLYSELDADGLA